MNNLTFVEYLNNIETVNSCKYITTLPTSCTMFLVSHYRFSNIIDELNSYIAILIAKSPSSKIKHLLIKHLYELYGGETESNSQIFLFKQYLQLFNSQNIYGEEYFSKYSLIEPYDMFCNKLHDIVKSKQLEYSLAVFATIKYIFSKISLHLASYTKKFINNNETCNYHEQYASIELKQSCEMFELLQSEFNDHLLICSAIDESYKLSMTFFDNLAQIF